VTLSPVSRSFRSLTFNFGLRNDQSVEDTIHQSVNCLVYPVRVCSSYPAFRLEPPTGSVVPYPLRLCSFFQQIRETKVFVSCHLFRITSLYFFAALIYTLNYLLFCCFFVFFWIYLLIYVLLDLLFNVFWLFSLTHQKKIQKTKTKQNLKNKNRRRSLVLKFSLTSTTTGG